MDKHVRKNMPAKRDPGQQDEDHIIRSENGLNPNRELYGGNKTNAERAVRDQKQSKESDPSSFPGEDER